jgi:hypothetical protein
MDAPGRVTNCASNGAARSCEQRERERERDRRATGRAMRKWETGTLAKSVSSGEGETYQGATWPPSPPHRVSSSLSQGVGSQQRGPLVGECLSKCFRAAGEPPSSLSEQPPKSLANHEGVEGAQQAPESLATVASRPSSSFGESRPPPKKARTEGCLSPFAQFVYVDGGLLCRLPLLVADHEPRRFYSNMKHTLGVLNFCCSMTRPEPLTPLSSIKTTQVGALGSPDSSLP